MAAKKKKGKKLPKKNPCFGCGAECCKYFAVYIEEPTEMSEYDAIKWYLHHQHVVIYIDREKDWYVHVEVPCKQMSSKGKCKIYESRPHVCRNYESTGCERADTDVENIAEFNSVDELDAFFKMNYRVVGNDLKRRHRKYRTS